MTLFHLIEPPSWTSGSFNANTMSAIPPLVNVEFFEKAIKDHAESVTS